jgi:hypothetical protein
MSAIALLLVHETSAHYPQFGPGLAAVLVAAIAMTELLGPLLAHFSLVRARETAEGAD